MPNTLWDIFAWVGMWFTASVGVMITLAALGHYVGRKRNGGTR